MENRNWKLPLLCGGDSPAHASCYLVRIEIRGNWKFESSKWKSSDRMAAERGGFLMQKMMCAAGVFVLGSTVAAFHSSARAIQQGRRAIAEQNWIEGVSDRRNVVVDMTYPLNEKFPAWPGDDHVFEAKANATVEKDGYFTRSFWMLEHYGTHMDAPAH